MVDSVEICGNSSELFNLTRLTIIILHELKNSRSRVRSETAQNIGKTFNGLNWAKHENMSKCCKIPNRCPISCAVIMCFDLNIVYCAI